MPSGRHSFSLAHQGRRSAALAGRFGGAAVLVLVVLSLTGPPVDAQLPTLPPLTTVPPDPATTTTTLLPPLVPTENLLPPAPGTTTPPAGILPLPIAPPPRRTTTFKPPPVPPSTPPRAVAAQPRSTRTTTGASTIPADEVEGAELGENDPGFGSALPFAPGQAELPTTADTTELGIEASTRAQVSPLASLAAGLLAIVLLGVALWLRSEARREPDVVPW